MILLELFTIQVVICPVISENCGSFRVEWIIAGCWISRHDTIVEHNSSRRTDVPQAYVVLLLRGRNYRLRIEWTKSPEVMISLAHWLVWIPEFKLEEAYYIMQHRWGYLEQSYCSAVQWNIQVVLVKLRVLSFSWGRPELCQVLWPDR